MKLSRLYTNKPEVFAPIDFNEGLNVVLGEIRLPENRKKDTHNLGKTTLARVIDFCLLKNGDSKLFLLKNVAFEDFVFFLELELLDGSHLTVRRATTDNTKISFKRHVQSNRDFTEATSWDHAGLPIEKAKELLDGALDLRDLTPWTYRKVVGYLLRAQEDFREVFHLKKFGGKHEDWKPFLANLLGFNATLLNEHYAKETELKKSRDEEVILQRELGGGIPDSSKIDGLLLLKGDEAEKKQRLLDAFDFRESDKEKTKLVVDDLDAGIAQLNAERYSLSLNKKKIAAALDDDEILFDPTSAAALFAEAGVVFDGQIKRDFVQLISFNRAITDERRGYLREELTEIDASLKRVNSDLSALGKKRSETLAFLNGADVFKKYKEVADELVTLKADIASLTRQQASLGRLQELRTAVRVLADEKANLQAAIEVDVKKQNSDKESLFSQIRLRFSEIVDAVIGRKALLSVKANQHGHLEFAAEILDDAGKTTSADSGFTYRKLLCVAFDLALTRAHLGGRYPRFVFHDGVFESLDDRKKENLVGVIRQYAELGIQHIVTLIDSDLPTLDGMEPLFVEADIVLRLHDEGESGRLFRMKAW
jgi:uncharacterized protein YydD (DUF2326 family)